MNETGIDMSSMIFLIGILVVLSIVIKYGSKKIGIPSLVGYIIFGFLIQFLDVKLDFMADRSYEILEFLAKVCVITLLFKIGLESNLSGLLGQLRRASLVWSGDVFFSGLLGFTVAYFILGLALTTSLFVAVALTATNVGISVGVWQETGDIKSPTGELLIDVAELDDISAIVLMALLFATIPVLQGEMHESLVIVVIQTTGLVILKLVLFGIFCVLFSKYIEKHITGFLRKIGSKSSCMLVIIGIGFVMAALAGLIGFSVAIGAFFAGLVFSRDPESVKIESSFDSLYELFSPAGVCTKSSK